MAGLGEALGELEQFRAALREGPHVAVEKGPDAGNLADEGGQRIGRFLFEKAAEELDRLGAMHHDALRCERHRERQRQEKDGDEGKRGQPRAPAQPVTQGEEHRPGREAQDSGEKDRAQEGLQDIDASDRQQGDCRDARIQLKTRLGHRAHSIGDFV